MHEANKNGVLFLLVLQLLSKKYNMNLGFAAQNIKKIIL